MRVRTKLVGPWALSLLVLLLIPVMARAETSSEINYGGHLPEVESIGPREAPRSKVPPNRHRTHQTTASGEASADKEGPGTTTEAETEESYVPGEATSGRGDEKPPPGGATDRGPGKTNAKADPGPDPRPVVNFTARPGRSNGSGGSSPLVPILIAVAALAALSIGVVVYSERSHRRR